MKHLLALCPQIALATERICWGFCELGGREVQRRGHFDNTGKK